MSLPLGSVQLRTLKGLLTLGGRDALLKLIALAGWIVMARWLDPASFGLFAIATFSINVFALFSQLGLGAAFVREHEQVPRLDMDALFTFQLTWLVAFAAVVWLAAPFASRIYGTAEVIWLVRVLAITLIVTSLRSVPTALFERELTYGPIVVADVVGQLTYWLVAVGTAALGLGWRSTIWALITAGVAGTGTLYARTDWRPSLRFNWQPVRESVLFGIMYQSQHVASFARYLLFPLFGAAAYGAAAVGYVTWAFQLAAIPVLLTNLVSRVSFPALARLHGDQEGFAKMLRSTLAWTCRLSFPAFAVVVGLGPQIIQYVYGAKWFPGLLSLDLFCLTMACSVFTGVLVPAVYSQGRGGVGLGVAVGWTILTWLSAIAMRAAGLGYETLAAACLIGTSAAGAVILIALRALSATSLLKAVRLPLAVALVGSAVLHLAAPLTVHGLWSLGAAAIATGAVMVGVNIWEDRYLMTAAARAALFDVTRPPLRGHE